MSHDIEEFQQRFDLILGHSRENGTGQEDHDKYLAQDAVAFFLDREAHNNDTWRDVSWATLAIAFSETDEAQLRAALVRHIAVLAQWMAVLDARSSSA